jgi:hypothetical protein
MSFSDVQRSFAFLEPPRNPGRTVSDFVSRFSMARKNLTARFVDAVSVEARADFWDDGVRGLVLRVSPTGVKSWTTVIPVRATGRSVE